MSRSTSASARTVALVVSIAALIAASCSSGDEPPSAAGPDTTEATPASALPAGAQEASLLYDFRAAGGTWSPLSESDSTVYVLELTGVSPTVTWFTDRPVRQAGSVPLNTALAMIGMGPDDPAPNAVVDVHQAPEDSDVVAVKLEAPTYSAATATLRFLATPLPTVDATSLSDLQERVDVSLPATFGPASLFVDDADTVIDSNGRPMDPAELGNYEWQYAVINVKGSAPFRVHVKAGPNGHANCVGQATVTDGVVDNGKYDHFIIGFSVNSAGSCWLQTSWQQWALDLEVVEGSNPTGWDTGAKGSGVVTFEYHHEQWNVDCDPIAVSGGQSGQAGSISCVGGRAGTGTLTG